MTAKIKDTIGKAAALLAIAPTYVEGTLGARRREAAALLAVLGLEPTSGAVHAALDAANGLLAAKAATSLEPLLARVKAVTGWSDGRLATVLDMTRASVQAYASGRSPERLSDAQKNILLTGLKSRRARIDALLEEMES